MVGTSSPGHAMLDVATDRHGVGVRIGEGIKLEECVVLGEWPETAV